MKKQSIYKIASLFSGCGGMDLGMEGGFKFLNKVYGRLQTELVYALDFEKKACEIFDANFDIKSVCKDIREVKANDIPDHDILTGGFPCQSFSVIAQNPPRLGFKDERGKLFFEICRILKEKKPQVFIAENVKGLLSANKGSTFPLIIKEFAKSGYHIQFKVLNAANFGVPQKRERVFIVGFRDKAVMENFTFPTPSHLIQPNVLRQIVIPEHEVESQYYFSDKAVEGLKKTKLSEIMNKGRAQPLDAPCNTVGAHLAKVSLNSTDPVLCINGRYRMFTPREVARIQSFPERFKIEGSKGVLYKALGNAVPPVLMWHVTQSVISALEKSRSTKKSKAIQTYSRLENYALV
jgi:DNA (cytosine-5)-methyltransferase 1